VSKGIKAAAKKGASKVVKKVKPGHRAHKGFACPSCGRRLKRGERALAINCPFHGGSDPIPAVASARARRRQGVK
jgi:predicted RNA-binding Zn-ribbon protein involved in translation (DUF1610 family)